MKSGIKPPLWYWSGADPPSGSGDCQSPCLGGLAIPLPGFAISHQGENQADAVFDTHQVFPPDVADSFREAVLVQRHNL